MNLKELKQKSINGRLTDKIVIDLSDLVEWDLEALNDYADEQLLGEDIEGSLSDINYRVAGFQPGDGQSIFSGCIILEVDADVSDLIGEKE